MAELANRVAHEADFARRIARLSARHKRELLTLLGEPPDPRNVPESFWERVKADMEAETATVLLLMFLDAGEQHLGEFLTGDLRATAAGDLSTAGQVWASTRAKSLADAFVANTRQAIASRAPDWAISDGLTFEAKSRQVLGDLTEVFGANRIERLAVTETTQAATAGTNGAIGQAGKMGVRVRVIWRTEKDARVCPICRPLDGQEMKHWEGAMAAAELSPGVIDQITAGGGPPAHVNCRCWLETIVEK